MTKWGMTDSQPAEKKSGIGYLFQYAGPLRLALHDL